jgi:hypothetical protein
MKKTWSKKSRDTVPLREISYKAYLTSAQCSQLRNQFSKAKSENYNRCSSNHTCRSGSNDIQGRCPQSCSRLWRSAPHPCHGPFIQVHHSAGIRTLLRKRIYKKVENPKILASKFSARGSCSNSVLV